VTGFARGSHEWTRHYQKNKFTTVSAN
jgi:hypothetical protein